MHVNIKKNYDYNIHKYKIKNIYNKKNISSNLTI